MDGQPLNNSEAPKLTIVQHELMTVEEFRLDPVVETLYGIAPNRLLHNDVGSPHDSLLFRCSWQKRKTDLGLRILRPSPDQWSFCVISKSDSSTNPTLRKIGMEITPPPNGFFRGDCYLFRYTKGT